MNGVSILAVDSTEPDLDNGLIGRGRYEWIEEHFGEREAFLRIFVLHHHLLPVPGTGRERNIVHDAGDALECLQRADVHLVLSRPQARAVRVAAREPVRGERRHGLHHAPAREDEALLQPDRGERRTASRSSASTPSTSRTRSSPSTRAPTSTRRTRGCSARRPPARPEFSLVSAASGVENRAIRTTGDRMRTRTPLLALTATIALLALAPAAQAATPFTAGTGTVTTWPSAATGPATSCGSRTEADDRIGYCRVPAGGIGVRFGVHAPHLPGADARTAQRPRDAQVFTPADQQGRDPGVVLALLRRRPHRSGPSAGSRPTTASDFERPGAEVGRTFSINGQAAFINSTRPRARGSRASTFQAPDDAVSRHRHVTASLAIGRLFVYSMPSVGVDERSTEAVYAVNDLDTVKYRVFTDAGTAGITAG